MTCDLLVVGADSVIGSALCTGAAESGSRVIGTTRRTETVAADRVYLDLAEAENWSGLPQARTAVICAGITQRAKCQAEPQATAQVNVAATLKLARRLADADTFTILLSSNLVLSGTVPRPDTDAPLAPQCEYGRQKAAAEQGLGLLGDRVAIVRLTKVLLPTFPLFAGWRRALLSGQPITPFAEMSMAPVPLAHVVTVIHLLALTHRSGIWHLSGEKDVTYTVIAQRLADQLGADLELVRPVAAISAGVAVPSPSHTTLGTSRLAEVFGISAPPVDWTLAHMLTGGDGSGPKQVMNRG